MNKQIESNISANNSGEKAEPNKKPNTQPNMTLNKIWRKIRRKTLKWLDDWRIAGRGLILSSRERRFLITTGVVTVFFGMILQFFSAGTANLDLMMASDWGGKISLIARTFIHLFGVNQEFIDWAGIFILALLQGVLIGMLVQLHHEKKRLKLSTASTIDYAQNAGLITGLAVLGAGCPTCGTTMLAPILGAIFSGSSYALASKISGWLTALCVVIALLSLKKLGVELYAIIITNKRKG